MTKRFLKDSYNLILRKENEFMMSIVKNEENKIFQVLKIVDESFKTFENVGKSLTFGEMTQQLFFELNTHLSHGLHSGVLSDMETLKFKNQFNNFIHEMLIIYVLNQQTVLGDSNLLKLHKNNLKHYGQNIFKTLNQHYHSFFPLHSKKIKIKI